MLFRSQISVTHNKKGKTEEQRPTERSPTSQEFTHTTGPRAGARLSGVWLARGGSRHPRRVGVRARAAEAGPGAECGPAVRAVAPPSRQRPAQSSGSVWRTGCPSAPLGAPPLAAAAPAARSRRVCAQHPAGRARRWRRRGALGSRARPLRAALQRPAGRPGSRDHVLRRWWGQGRSWAVGRARQARATALAPTPCTLPRLRRSRSVRNETPRISKTT